MLFEGYGAAAGNAPYIGYRCSGGTCLAVVKQNYFPPSIAGIYGPGSYLVDSVGIKVFHILATTDGGRTWTQQFSAPRP